MSHQTGVGSYDILIVGGGPAGLMAAISAAHVGARVLMLEKGERLGKKLLISGGGRCNVTNARGTDYILRNIPGNPRFLQSVFTQWSSEDIMSFFEGLGVALKEEDRGRMFPVTDRSSTVLSALVKHLQDMAVDVIFKAAVDRLWTDDGKLSGVFLNDGRMISAPCVVVATGGCSVPETGSTGDGYVLAKQAGHTIIPPYPTSVPLLCNDFFIRDRLLQGVSLKDIEQTLYDSKGKVITREEGDMIFTHFGISGPATLRTSQYAVKAMQKSDVNSLLLAIDLVPCKSADVLHKALRDAMLQQPKRTFQNLLKDHLPNRLAELVVRLLQIADDHVCANVSTKALEEALKLLKAFPVHVNGSLGLKRATVTGGGVNVKEINPSTMESKILSGLFFAGEVIDVHAHTGGYNITVAFSTGYVAGHHAATRVVLV